MPLFSEVKAAFAEKNCELLTSYDEYLKIPKQWYGPYNIKASCGHEIKAHLHTFKNRNSGVKCIKCINKDNSEQKKKNGKSEEGTSTLLDLEAQTIIYLEQIIGEFFIVKKTFGGCLADIAIKPITIEEDEWFPRRLRRARYARIT